MWVGIKEISTNEVCAHLEGIRYKMWSGEKKRGRRVKRSWLAPISIIYQIHPSINTHILLTLSTLSIMAGSWGGLNQTQLCKIIVVWARCGVKKKKKSVSVWEHPFPPILINGYCFFSNLFNLKKVFVLISVASVKLNWMILIV